jgi:hypothetical protein
MNFFVLIIAFRATLLEELLCRSFLGHFSICMIELYSIYISAEYFEIHHFI